MGSFTRREIEAKENFRRLEADMKVILGAGEVKHLQPLAQDKTDGKFYVYVKGDENKGIIAGLYTGENHTAVDGELGTITTQAVVAKDDIQGVIWTEDFTAFSQIKLSGIILTDSARGTKEA